MEIQGDMLMRIVNVDFWGPASNFGIPIAAVMDTQKSPELYVPIPPFPPLPCPSILQLTISQHLRHHDRRISPLLRDLHALRIRR